MKRPAILRLLTQRVVVVPVPDLHVPCDEDRDDPKHAHAAFGVYDEASQTISLCEGLGFDRERETLLHESLHGMFALCSIDAMLAALPGADEHIVSVLTPVLLAYLRDNPGAVAYLQEVHS